MAKLRGRGVGSRDGVPERLGASPEKGRLATALLGPLGNHFATPGKSEKVLMPFRSPADNVCMGKQVRFTWPTWAIILAGLFSPILFRLFLMLEAVR